MLERVLVVNNCTPAPLQQNEGDALGTVWQTIPSGVARNRWRFLSDRFERFTNLVTAEIPIFQRPALWRKTIFLPIFHQVGIDKIFERLSQNHIWHSEDAELHVLSQVRTRLSKYRIFWFEHRRIRTDQPTILLLITFPAYAVAKLKTGAANRRLLRFLNRILRWML